VDGTAGSGRGDDSEFFISVDTDWKFRCRAERRSGAGSHADTGFGCS
jgi:hypothetical protein